MALIGIIVVFAVLSIIAIDIGLAMRGGAQATLSWWLYTKSLKYPAIPAAFGLVAGLLLAHFFWNQALTGCPK